MNTRKYKYLEAFKNTVVSVVSSRFGRGLQPHFAHPQILISMCLGEKCEKRGGGNPIFYRSPGIWICGWKIFVRLKRCVARQLGYVNLTRDFFQIRVSVIISNSLYKR